MNMTFFLVALFTARPGQVMELPVGAQLNQAPIADQLAEAERQLQSFRSSWVVLAVTRGPDDKPEPMMGPNEKLMTLESVVTELELDCLGKKSLSEQLTQMGPGQMPMTPELQALLASDGKLAQYEHDVQDLEDFLRSKRQQYGNKHQIVIRAEQQYQDAKQRLNEETAYKTLLFNNQQISQAQQSYLRSREMLCKAEDQLTQVKSEQRVRDRQMAEYLRLLENRNSLRLRLSEEQEASELAKLRGMTLEELKAAVQRARAALEKAQRTHQQAVAVLNEAIEQSNQPGNSESATQPDSKPAGE